MSNFQTNNQSYGSHYTRTNSLNKAKITTTLDFLKQNDQKGFIH